MWACDTELFFLSFHNTKVTLNAVDGCVAVL